MQELPPHIHQYIVCADVFIKRENRFLMIKRSAQKKYAPNVVAPIGGKVDRGENAYAAAIREVAEEAGVTIANLRLEAVKLEVQPYKHEPYDWLIFHFSADYVSGEPKQTWEGELLWMTPEEILAQDLFPSVRAIIQHLLDDRGGLVFCTNHFTDEKEPQISQHFIDICHSPSPLA